MDVIPQTKRCSGCGEVKAASEFFKNKRTKDGLQTYCKACIRGYKQQWRENPEVREKERDYARQRQDCILSLIVRQRDGGEKNILANTMLL